ncbi:hypothetical protein ACFUEJ_22735, partial [Gordonia sp. NPDC057258]|uniref:hypothetical protein n=1 Tax=unclassified Gordonia (in: high G+C Gram-positive bacteria) TaxID=2657482 RepID=UPI00363C52C7
PSRHDPYRPFSALNRAIRTLEPPGPVHGGHAMPACAIRTADGTRVECVVMGYTRGVLISVIVRFSSGGSTTLTNQGVAEMLRLYSVQSERIANWNPP